MIRAAAPLLLLLAAGGCSDYPRDVEGTYDHIVATREMRVGIVALPPEQQAKARQLIDSLEASTGATAVAIEGASEPLLLQLEQGGLDLVVAPFDSKSPWSTRVTLGPPIATIVDADPPHHLMPASRNGENGWIAQVHAAARQVAAR